MVKIRRNMFSTVLLLATTGMMMSPHAGAMLVEMDYQHRGDGMITHDSSTGMDWLDLSMTSGMSYNAVQAELGAGGHFSGFRYATHEEVGHLMFNSAGITDVNKGYTPKNANSIAFLQDFIGITDPSLASTGYSVSSGITGTMNSRGELLGAYMEVNYRTAPSYVPEGYASYCFDGDACSGRSPDFTGDSFGYAGSASFLVRNGGFVDGTNKTPAQVPLPATVWLLLSGLLGMGFFGRKSAK